MPSLSFASLSLPEPLLKNLETLGYTAMTPVQAMSLPPILQSRDVIAQAQTGSGKTAAFGIGVLSRLDVRKFAVQSLVLCPTRELADQVAKELRRLARFAHNVKVLTLCGGTPFGPQLGSLRHGAHIVVGTPGRVLQHLERGSLDVGGVTTLVLDEADRMLDMGFIEEMQQVITHVNPSRQTLLFSATFPEEIGTLSEGIQNAPIRIETPDAQRPCIEERFYEVERDGKPAALVDVLSTFRPARSIVFCNTKLESNEVAQALRDRGIDALAIHGDLEQYERIDVLVQFGNRSCSVLVATDVAARGLDIKELEAVINYDLPHNEAIYTHRIGRTGRAGESGLAVTLFVGADEALEADTYRGEGRLFEEASELEHQEDFTLTPPNRTLVIEGGKKDKVRPGDLLGALTGEAGIEGRFVGKIDIFDRQSYVAIDRQMADTAYERLKNGKIKGRKFPVWVLE
jgi:ATP-dependent RNA helicase DbpA